MLDGESEFEIDLILNGKEFRALVPAGITLFELLRDRCGLSGTKLACSRAACGACTVIVGGRPATSCSLFAFQAEGATVTTIEGLAKKNSLHPIQASFRSHSAFQCGYCTPGMIMLAKALLDREAAPSPARVKEWMTSNICRCTGYKLIIEAVLDAAKTMREAAANV
jgi:carbon-monoxide dehydrogenase small subunit